MIGYLSGKIKFIFGEEIILDVNGIGYRIFVNPANLEVGAVAEFFIHTAVKEDAINLYGFKNRETFELFENLLTVGGIGAKSALAIVSKISVTEFVLAIVSQDLNALTKLPGVGKKSAQRILLELKDKIKNLQSDSIAQVSIPIPNSSAFDEATEALSALGYTSEEISNVFKVAPKNSTTEQLIKFALQKLNRFI